MEVNPATWLVTDGVSVIAGWILANGLEPSPKWQKLDGYRKRLIVMAITILMAPLAGLGLYWVVTAVLPGREIILLAFQAGFVAYAGSQYAHAPKLAQADRAKELGSGLLEAYRENLGMGSALTSDGATRFAYRAQRLAENALDKRARS